jgi:NADPH-dependent 2,4-dienoyl-CoA reductase/sulfur reductase-like enzyme
MKQTIIVIGGLAAGPSAASKAKRVNPDADVLLFERGEHVSYGICEIPYYVGGTITDVEYLVPFDASKLERTRGVRAKIGHSVEELLPTKKRIIVRDLERDKVVEFSYDKLIVATGSSPRKLPDINVSAKNVFQLKSLSDGMAIERFVSEKKPKHGVIIVGGYVGMEMCEALVGRDMKVALLHPEALPLSGLEEETRRAVLAELTQNGVDFKPLQNVKQFVTDGEGYVTKVVTDQASFDSDVVIVSIGVEPNSVLASRAGLRRGTYNGILTDERQLTSDDSIFAAGDCCEVRSLITRRWMYIPLGTYAARQGRVAGENAAGGHTLFKGALRAIAVKVFGLEVAQVGLSFAEAVEAGFDAVKVEVTSDSMVRYFPGNEEINIVGIADRRSKRLLGANVFGGRGSVLRANLLGFAIQHAIDADALFHSDQIYSPPFAPLWDPVLVFAGELRKVLGDR